MIDHNVGESAETKSLSFSKVAGSIFCAHVTAKRIRTDLAHRVGCRIIFEQTCVAAGKVDKAVSKLNILTFERSTFDLNPDVQLALVIVLIEAKRTAEGLVSAILAGNQQGEKQNKRKNDR